MEKIIEIQKDDINLKELVGAESNVDLSKIPPYKLLAEMVALTDYVDKLKGNLKLAATYVETLSPEKIEKSLIDSGLLKEGETAIIHVNNQLGGKEIKSKVTFEEKTDSGFTVSKELSDKEILAKVPDFMKVVKVQRADAKDLENLYNTGAIPTEFLGYFSTHPTTKTVVTVKDITSKIKK